MRIPQILYGAHFAPQWRARAVVFQKRNRFPIAPAAFLQMAQRFVRHYFRPVMRMALAAVAFAVKAVDT